MLKINDLSITAGSFHIDSVNMSVSEGTCHMLLGPTGSGKTLILETIAGLYKPLKGSIFLYHRDVTAVNPENRGISYLPQDLSLFPNMSVRENISYGLRVKGAKKEEYGNKVADIANSLGISGLLDRTIHNLSGGEKQRTALARAIASGNKILLLDEPLTALNHSIKREIWQLLKEFQKEFGLTYVMVTHDLEEALFLGNTLSLISNGKIIQTGDKNSVYYFPQSIEAAKIMGVENFYPAEVLRIDENSIALYCAELDGIFHTKINNRRYPTGIREKTSVTIGIRAKDIVLPADSHKPLSGRRTNHTHMTVKSVFFKGAASTVILAKEREPGIKMMVEIFNTHSQSEPVPFQQTKADVYLPEDRLLVFPS